MNRFWIRRNAGRLLLVLVLIAGAFVMIAPFLWVFSASVRPFQEAVSLPPKWLPPDITKWNIGNYMTLFSDKVPFLKFVLNSFTMSTVITIGMVVHGTAAGYAYARLNFKGKKLMFSLMMVAMMIPIQVTIIPLYQIMSKLGVVDTQLAVTLPSIFGAMCPGLAGAFGIFLMRQFFKTLPKELEEAAAIDGAGVLRTFFSIMLPTAKSTIVSLAIIVFSFAWNDYFTSFIMINKTAKMPLPVGILAIRQPFSTGDQIEFAAVVLSILPVLIVFIIGQKWIVKSMVQAGIKG